MPKELIYSEALPYGEKSAARSVVGVHWGLGDHLQVSSSLFNDDGLYFTADGLEHQAEGEDAARREAWARGYYVGLNRRQVNHLIKTLRRARDQAFGRDE